MEKVVYISANKYINKTCIAFILIKGKTKLQHAIEHVLKEHLEDLAKIVIVVNEHDNIRARKITHIIPSDPKLYEFTSFSNIYKSVNKYKNFKILNIPITM